MAWIYFSKSLKIQTNLFLKKKGYHEIMGMGFQWFSFFITIILAVPQGIQDLSSLTWDGTCAPCSGLSGKSLWFPFKASWMWWAEHATGRRWEGEIFTVALAQWVSNLSKEVFAAEILSLFYTVWGLPGTENWGFQFTGLWIKRNSTHTHWRCDFVPLRAWWCTKGNFAYFCEQKLIVNQLYVERRVN